MKREILSKKVLEQEKIDYENGYTCLINYEDSKITSYTFFKGKQKRYYVDKETQKELTSSHWNNHHDILNKQTPLTKKEILDFSKFEDLWYVGCGYDGKLINGFDEEMTSVLIMGDVFSQIYLEIETSKQECEDILETLNKDYILEYKIVEIPYYNQNDDKDEHFTLVLKVLLPQELYKLINKKLSSDDKKIEAFKLLKK